MRELWDILRKASPDVREANADLLDRATKQQRTAAGKTMGSEEAEQMRLFQMADDHMAEYPELKLLFHVPNGGWRAKAEAGRFKAMGVKAGVPDLVLPCARGGYHGLFVEMKSINGRIQDSQWAWVSALIEQGYFTVIAFSADEAWHYIIDYLRMPK